MIQIKSFVFSPFQENTFVLYDETKECVIIDPGCHEIYEKDELTGFIEENQLKPVLLLNTHCHIDHVFGNKFVSEQYNLLPVIHELDLPTLTQMTPGAAQLYQLSYEASPLPEEYIEEGDVIEFGNSKLDVLFTPGHAPGHVVFVCHAQQFVINGDVLFQGSIGRTDFPGCSHEELINSIKTKLFPLGDDYVIYTGHGPATNIAFEKANNPFVGE